MEILFTRHALERLRERAVSEQEVYEIFAHPILVLERRETIVIGRTDRGRYLTLVMDLAQRRLLTLWPASRAERRSYRGKMEKEEL